MKYATSSNVISSGLIGRDLNAVKTIVTLCICDLLNPKLPTGLALIQKIETRFGTAFDVATRFNESFPYLRPTLYKSDFDSARKALHLLDM